MNCCRRIEGWLELSTPSPFPDQFPIGLRSGGHYVDCEFVRFRHEAEDGIDKNPYRKIAVRVIGVHTDSFYLGGTQRPEEGGSTLTGVLRVSAGTLKGQPSVSGMLEVESFYLLSKPVLRNYRTMDLEVGPKATTL